MFEALPLGERHLFDASDSLMGHVAPAVASVLPAFNDHAQIAAFGRPARLVGDAFPSRGLGLPASEASIQRLDSLAFDLGLVRLESSRPVIFPSTGAFDMVLARRPIDFSGRLGHLLHSPLSALFGAPGTEFKSGSGNGSPVTSQALPSPLANGPLAATATVDGQPSPVGGTTAPSVSFEPAVSAVADEGPATLVPAEDLLDQAIEELVSGDGSEPLSLSTLAALSGLVAGYVRTATKQEAKKSQCTGNDGISDGWKAPW
jgi:hypothetical protein